MAEAATDGGLSRSDALLAGIAASLVAAATVGVLPSVPMTYALGVGSLPAGGGVWYALFREPAARE